MCRFKGWIQSCAAGADSEVRAFKWAPDLQLPRQAAAACRIHALATCIHRWRIQGFNGLNPKTMHHLPKRGPTDAGQREAASARSHHSMHGTAHDSQHTTHSTCRTRAARHVRGPTFGTGTPCPRPAPRPPPAAPLSPRPASAAPPRPPPAPPPPHTCSPPAACVGP